MIFSAATITPFELLMSIQSYVYMEFLLLFLGFHSDSLLIQNPEDGSSYVIQSIGNNVHVHMVQEHRSRININTGFLINFKLHSF
jgi:hypothetical protein